MIEGETVHNHARLNLSLIKERDEAVLRAIERPRRGSLLGSSLRTSSILPLR